MLELINVNKHYKKKHALKDFSACFSSGVYALLGPNGAGKSTLMNIISQNLSPDEGGRILWDGKEIKKLKSSYFKILGFMPQQQALYDNFSAYQFMYYLAALKGITKARAREQVPELLRTVELEQIANQKISSFSGGMKQRLLIAQALIGDPKVILLDEPTAGLDPKQRVIIRNLIKNLSSDRTILISTHIVSDVETIADMFFMMKDGSLIAKGSITELCSEDDSCSNIENLYMKLYDDSSKQP